MLPVLTVRDFEDKTLSDWFDELIGSSTEKDEDTFYDRYSRCKELAMARLLEIKQLPSECDVEMAYLCHKVPAFVQWAIWKEIETEFAK